MSASTPSRPSATPDARRSGWIPWVFVGGMLTVVLVNAVLVYASVSTFSGVTVGRAYERGRGYDQVLAEASRQDALGWRADVTLAGDTLRVTVRDSSGQPVTGRVEGVLRRPLEGIDLPLDFAAVGSGRWAAVASPPKPGQWEARLTLFGLDGQPFDIRQRVLVP
jgi:nitrogen fixation protein FixH